MPPSSPPVPDVGQVSRSQVGLSLTGCKQDASTVVGLPPLQVTVTCPALSAVTPVAIWLPFPSVTTYETALAFPGADVSML
jgi:hypothetical protein